MKQKLEAEISADSSKLKEGIAEAEKGVKSLSSTSKVSLKDMARMFGIASNAIGVITQGFRAWIEVIKQITFKRQMEELNSIIALQRKLLDANAAQGERARRGIEAEYGDRIAAAKTQTAAESLLRRKYARLRRSLELDIEGFYRDAEMAENSVPEDWKNSTLESRVQAWEKAQENADAARRKAYEANEALVQLSRNFQRELLAMQAEFARKAEEDAAKRKAAIESRRAAEEKAYADEKKRIEDNAKTAADAWKKALSSRQEALKNQAAAEKAVFDALEREKERKRANAHEAEISRIERENERRRAALGKFGFSLGDVSPDESAGERRRRLAQQTLDAGIAEKYSRQVAGERVRYSGRERRRLEEYLELQGGITRGERKIAALTEAEKQLRASREQQEAASAIREAAITQKNASRGLQEAAQNFRRISAAIGDLRDFSAAMIAFRRGKFSASDVRVLRRVEKLAETIEENALILRRK